MIQFLCTAPQHFDCHSILNRRKLWDNMIIFSTKQKTLELVNSLWSKILFVTQMFSSLSCFYFILKISKRFCSSWIPCNKIVLIIVAIINYMNILSIVCSLSNKFQDFRLEPNLKPFRRRFSFTYNYFSYYSLIIADLNCARN